MGQGVSLTSIFNKMKCLDRNVIKYIAMACMVIDHIGQAFLIEGTAGYFILSIFIGRFDFPIFATLVVEGMTRTHHLVRNICLTAGFAIVTEPIFDLYCFGVPFDFAHQNIMWVYLAFGLFYLVVTKTETDKKNLKIIRYIGLSLLGAGMIALAYFTNLDYSCWGLLGMMIGLPIYKKTGYAFAITWSVAAIEMLALGWWTYIFPMIVMMLYDANKQCSHTPIQKYSMYAIYPVHLGVLDIIMAIFGVLK